MKTLKRMSMIVCLVLVFALSASAVGPPPYYSHAAGQNINWKIENDKYYLHIGGDLYVNRYGENTGVQASYGIFNNTDGGRVIPRGYLKVFCYLYNVDGSLIEAAASPYIGLSSNELYSVETKLYDIPGEYYIMGEAWYYNINTGDYDSVKTIKSPRVTYIRTSQIANDIPYMGDANTSRGLFGSALDGQNLDLIPAVGANGANGYIRTSDLYGEVPENPEAAAALPTLDRTIPLYTADGVSVVGQFIVKCA